MRGIAISGGGACVLWNKALVRSLKLIGQTDILRRRRRSETKIEPSCSALAVYESHHRACMWARLRARLFTSRQMRKEVKHYNTPAGVSAAQVTAENFLHES